MSAVLRGVCSRCGSVLGECTCPSVGASALEMAQDRLNEVREQLEPFTGGAGKRAGVPVEVLLDVLVRVERARMALRAVRSA